MYDVGTLRVISYFITLWGAATEYDKVKTYTQTRRLIYRHLPTLQ